MTEVLTIISGIFTFWSEVTWFVKLLQATPAEQQDALIAAMQKEAATTAATGRPTWS